ncbi:MULTISPECIES: superoxide dismutase family protein [unclassified Bacillus (in: firmicutes)]|uniref:superoxide dismutase family protein n=1 Tax=unclassified Bacillus (in: firmicutes) TaxID=185979 RepID=UPI000B890911|nr:MULTISPECIES: superoxide dismutase family protein [unclassified Bacillus (in: firmicutes)]
MKKQLVLGCFAAILFAGCAKENPKEIEVKLYNASGDQVGTAKVAQQSSGVKISIKAEGLTPGVHGVHIHEVGQCQAPDFISAGDHFNPNKKKHGLLHPKGFENGDLPNVIADGEGKIKVDITAPQVALKEGKTTMNRKDGASLIITENADDGMTQPAGNSGKRIVCGVIVKKASDLKKEKEKGK